MLVWLALPFYDFCGFRSVAVNSVYKLQFFTFIVIIHIRYLYINASSFIKIILQLEHFDFESTQA